MHSQDGISQCNGLKCLLAFLRIRTSIQLSWLSEWSDSHNTFRIIPRSIQSHAICSSVVTMYAVEFPDWKKIGWHVGKRLKDILDPPKDTGPSKQERRARRLQDGLQGFVYFDNFDEVEAWTVEIVDPIQVSNTPLEKRSAQRVHDQKWPVTSVLICHDYKGLILCICYNPRSGLRPCRGLS